MLLVCYAISAMSLRLPGESSACQRHPPLLPPDQVVLLRAAEGEALSCLGPNLLPRPLSTFLLHAFWDLLVAARAGWGGLRRTRCKQAPGEFGVSSRTPQSPLFLFPPRASPWRRTAVLSSASGDKEDEASSGGRGRHVAEGAAGSGLRRSEGAWP